MVFLKGNVTHLETDGEAIEETENPSTGLVSLGMGSAAGSSPLFGGILSHRM